MSKSYVAILLSVITASSLGCQCGPSKTGGCTSSRCDTFAASSCAGGSCHASVPAKASQGNQPTGVLASMHGRHHRGPQSHTGPLGPSMGPHAPTVAYPYYTTRGPRDFLATDPASIGP